MSSFFSNPAYLIPAVILCWAAIYYLFGVIDKVGLETRTVKAIVTSTTYTPGSTNFINRIAGGRSWIQAQKQPDFYAISLTIDGEPTVALVTEEKFVQLKMGDRVRATISKTRISQKLQVIDVYQ